MNRIAINFLNPIKDGICPIAIAYDKLSNYLTICVLNCMIDIKF